jgi:hypothetical protein
MRFLFTSKGQEYGPPFCWNTFGWWSAEVSNTLAPGLKLVSGPAQQGYKNSHQQKLSLHAL